MISVPSVAHSFAPCELEKYPGLGEPRLSGHTHGNLEYTRTLYYTCVLNF